MIRTRVYRGGVLDGTALDPARISDVLVEPDTVVWVDLCQPDHAELSCLAEEVGLNPLAVEDAVKGRQRAKLDRYADHLFLTVYAISLDERTAELRTDELAVFVAPRYLITVRREPEPLLDAVVTAWDGSADLAGHGVGFLLHGLLDVVVDGHFATVERLDSEIEQLEDLLFDPRPHGADLQRRSYQLRKSLVLLRRVVLPMREVLNTLMRREVGLVDDAMLPHFHDIYDHVLRATEWTESLRDLVTTIYETHLTIQGNRLNDVMKKVTSYAALFAVPTAVSGYYGMNVRVWPAAGTLVGGVVALVLMFGLSALLFLAFRRHDWL